MMANARADTCKDAFTQAPKLAGSGKLLAARDQLRTCSAQGCPAAMRSVCVHDLESLGATRSDGRAQRAGPADGPRPGRRDGVDRRRAPPGRPRWEGSRHRSWHARTFRFVSQLATFAESSVLIREGEKDRVLAVDWQPAAPAAEAATHRPIPARARGSRAASPSWRWGVWAFLAGVDGFVKESQLGSCKGRGRLPEGRRSSKSTQTMFNVADIAGGTAVCTRRLDVRVHPHAPERGVQGERGLDFGTGPACSAGSF